jgi:hypothetical protein
MWDSFSPSEFGPGATPPSPPPVAPPVIEDSLVTPPAPQSMSAPVEEGEASASDLPIPNLSPTAGEAREIAAPMSDPLRALLPGLDRGPAIKVPAGVTAAPTAGTDVTAPPSAQPTAFARTSTATAESDPEVAAPESSGAQASLPSLLPGLDGGPVFDVPTAFSGDMDGESAPTAASLPLGSFDGASVIDRLLKGATEIDGLDTSPPSPALEATAERAAAAPTSAPTPTPKRIDPSTEPLLPGMRWEWRRPDPDAPALDPKLEKRIREIVREEFRERDRRSAARFRSRHVLMIDE